MPTNKSLILFDGDCALCNKLVQFVVERDRAHNFLFAPLQSNIGQVFLKRGGLPSLNYSSFIYMVHDQTYEKSTAGLKLLKDIGGVWKVFYLLMIIPKPLRDWIYNLVAKNRFSIFGYQNYCMTPSPELRQQFLE